MELEEAIRLYEINKDTEIVIHGKLNMFFYLKGSLNVYFI